MSRTWGHLRIFVPKGGCPLHIPYSVGQMQLPEQMQAEASDVLQALHEGGVILLKDADAENGNVLDRSLDEWAKAFPDLDLKAELGPTDANGPMLVALIQGKTATSNAWEGEPCLTLAQLRTLEKEGRSLEQAIVDLDWKCPSYEVGDLEVEIDVR